MALYAGFHAVIIAQYPAAQRMALADLIQNSVIAAGGHMIKKMTPVRTANYTRKDRTAVGHEIEVRYIAAITV